MQLKLTPILALIAEADDIFARQALLADEVSKAQAIREGRGAPDKAAFVEAVFVIESAPRQERELAARLRAVVTRATHFAGNARVEYNRKVAAHAEKALATIRATIDPFFYGRDKDLNQLVRLNVWPAVDRVRRMHIRPSQFPQSAPAIDHLDDVKFVVAQIRTNAKELGITLDVDAGPPQNQKAPAPSLLRRMLGKSALFAVLVGVLSLCAPARAQQFGPGPALWNYSGTFTNTPGSVTNLSLNLTSIVNCTKYDSFSLDVVCNFTNAQAGTLDFVWATSNDATNRGTSTAGAGHRGWFSAVLTNSGTTAAWSTQINVGDSGYWHLLFVTNQAGQCFTGIVIRPFFKSKING